MNVYICFSTTSVSSPTPREELRRFEEWRENMAISEAFCKIEEDALCLHPDSGVGGQDVVCAFWCAVGHGPPVIGRTARVVMLGVQGSRPSQRRNELAVLGLLRPCSFRGLTAPPAGTQTLGTRPCSFRGLTAPPVGTQTLGTRPCSFRGLTAPPVGTQTLGTRPCSFRGLTAPPVGTQTLGTQC